MRDLAAMIVAPILKLTGFRFSKTWRVEERGIKPFIFRHILNTTKANIIADIP
jgi:hypothetical protein